MPSSSLTPSPDSTICFANRMEAGEHLAQKISDLLRENSLYKEYSLVSYALPRGGLAVAVPIAQRLCCPLDVIVAKKITRPENPELAIGAVTADGHTLWLSRSRSRWELSDCDRAALESAQNRAESQYQQFAASRPQCDPAGAIGLIVDDGIATGMTMAVAIQSLRAKRPAQVWICVPVAPPEVMPYLQQWADRVVVLGTPNPFLSVSRFYKEFTQVEMLDAIAYLQAANSPLNLKCEENL